MLESIASILTATKSAGTPTIAAIFVATSLLLFVPDDIAATLGMLEFRATYRAYLGVAWIGCASLLAIQSVIGVFSLGREKYRSWRVKKNAHEHLSELTLEEKEFLRPFIRDGKNTRLAKIYDGAPAGLVAKGLIYCASSLSAPGGAFPFNLQPFARKALRKNPSLLD
jgi:hypothetical protein